MDLNDAINKSMNRVCDWLGGPNPNGERKPSKNEQLLREVMHSTAAELTEKLQKLADNAVQRISSAQDGNNDLVMEELRDLKLSLKSISSRLDEMNHIITKLDEKLSLPAEPIHVIPQAVELPRFPQELYAMMFDSTSPISFDPGSLTDNQAECVFKLTINDERSGKFEFTSNAEVQRQILEAFDPIVVESSEYENPLFNPNRIIIESPGSIELIDGTWQVTKKQIIKFV